ncbi:hypothetical protein [Aeromonas sp. 601039]|uniref:hypothetical protein n=1 Tax=Aeromonas sp. 601039 TaxID=2712037 RepID=UPI003BA3E0E5
MSALAMANVTRRFYTIVIVVKKKRSSEYVQFHVGKDKNMILKINYRSLYPVLAELDGRLY